VVKEKSSCLSSEKKSNLAITKKKRHMVSTRGGGEESERSYAKETIQKKGYLNAKKKTDNLDDTGRGG